MIGGQIKKTGYVTLTMFIWE